MAGVAIVALGLGIAALVAAGVYAVMAYALNERRQEFGIRMALGANRVGLVRMVLLRGLTLTALGLAAGTLALAVAGPALVNAVESPLRGDLPLVACGVALVLLITTAAASFFPARRASRVDPMITLRSQ